MSKTTPAYSYILLPLSYSVNCVFVLPQYKFDLVTGEELLIHCDAHCLSTAELKLVLARYLSFNWPTI